MKGPVMARMGPGQGPEKTRQATLAGLWFNSAGRGLPGLKFHPCKRGAVPSAAVMPPDLEPP
jgi:hypothetical protein